MKTSINRLPKCTRVELTSLLNLIREQEIKCDMIILYGSYARGNYILWDEREEYGVRTSYQSDYDLLIVTSIANIRVTEHQLRKVRERYNRIFECRRHASPQFIVEHINTVNNRLGEGHYFFTDIIREGIKLFDNGCSKLGRRRSLNFSEIKALAKEEFNIHYPNALGFLKHGYYAANDGEYVLGSFLLHQSCERFYNAVSLVFSNYRPKNHKLNELGPMTARFSRELADVFPTNTDEQKACFELLCRAYIEARYNRYFAVSKEQLKFLLSRVEVLREITYRICSEQLASYEELVYNEKKERKALKAAQKKLNSV